MSLPPDDRPAQAVRSVSPARRRPLPDFGPTDTLRGWIVTAFLTAVAAITRFTMLNHPTEAGTPVFDEKHYAPQAWQMATGGGWIEDNPGFGLVVHPPVGKQLIALGELLFGYNGWGWRFSAAVAGTLLVLLVVRIVRRLARSTMIGAIAGILLIADGVTFVSSRLGMLDIFLALLATAAFGCLIVDRDQVRARLARADAAGRTTAGLGPRLGVRWWRFGAGVLLGVACGTKWSGLYFIAFFGLLCLGFDIAARRAYGVRRPWLSTARHDLAPAVYALLIVPIVVYLGSYGAWFASETGIDRYEVGVKIGAGGSFSFVPDALRSLWYYSGAVLEFHEHLTNSAGNHHPWESKPWTWPMGLRPMLYYYAGPPQHITGCGREQCVKAVMLLGTPAIWWLAFPVLGWALWRTVIRRDWRYAAILTAYGAAFLPWFGELDRQMYYFYAVALAPFLVMALALVLGEVLGRANDALERRGTGLLAVCLYLGLVIANFVWIWPILTGMPIAPSTWNNELWLPSWR